MQANPICLHGGGGENSNNGKSLGTITKLQAMPENKGLEENIPSDALKLVELFALQELSCESLTRKKKKEPMEKVLNMIPMFIGSITAYVSV